MSHNGILGHVLKKLVFWWYVVTNPRGFGWGTLFRDTPKYRSQWMERSINKINVMTNLSIFLKWWTTVLDNDVWMYWYVATWLEYDIANLFSKNIYLEPHQSSLFKDHLCMTVHIAVTLTIHRRCLSLFWGHDWICPPFARVLQTMRANATAFQRKQHMCQIACNRCFSVDRVLNSWRLRLFFQVCLFTQRTSFHLGKTHQLPFFYISNRCC